MFIFQGHAEVFNKDGESIKEFKAAIPGRFKDDNAVLDCILNEKEKTFFILDLVEWHGLNYMEYDTSFRLHWLKQKIEEDCPHVTKFSKDNIYKFIPLPFMKCDKESLTILMTEPMPFTQKLDGILFYDMMSPYISGISSRVLWLEPFMLEEILDIKIPAHFNLKPKNYSDAKKYIEDYQKKEKIKRNFRKHHQRKIFSDKKKEKALKYGITLNL